MQQRISILNIIILFVVIFSAVIIGLYLQSQYRFLGNNIDQNQKIINNLNNVDGINAINNEINEIRRNWFNLAGIILTFTGFLLGLVNLVIFFNFIQKSNQISDENKINIAKIDNVLKDLNELHVKYTAAIKNEAKLQLITDCHTVFRAKCSRDMLKGKTKHSAGVFSLLQTYVYLSSYFYEVDYCIRQTYIREIAKQDIEVLKELRNKIMGRKENVQAYLEDLKYLNHLLDVR